jgi:hypothetical protein
MRKDSLLKLATDKSRTGLIEAKSPSLHNVGMERRRGCRIVGTGIAANSKDTAVH